MREIKFRAPYYIKEGMAYFTLKELGFHDSIGGDVDLEKAEQFTGLHDATGKEIYEGDIYYHISTGNKGVVCFDEGRFFADGKNISCFLSLVNINDGEVIGNIHENPELIK